ncbi:MAG: exosortase C-terminal domain/associated protein EpsI [Sphingomonas sp.]
MTGMTRRGFIASAACVAVAGLGQVWAAPARTGGRRADLDGTIPTAFAGWRTSGDLRPILPDEGERRAIEDAYDDSLARVYARPDGAIVMLVIAHGDLQTGLLAIHRPETCYAAQGFTVIPGGEQPIAGGDRPIAARRLLAIRDLRSEPILTYMTIAGRQTGFGLPQNVALFRAAWSGERPEGFLVRVSTFGPDGQASYGMLAGFLEALLTAASPMLRRQLGG